MERNEEKMRRQSKVMSIVAVVVCVVALTVGFAAFSNTLTIKSGAAVTPNASDFNVEFSTSWDGVEYGILEPLEGTGTTIEIKEGMDSISGISATVGGYGITRYEIPIYNTGKYRAYLNEIMFENVPNWNSEKKCTPKISESNSLVDEACDIVEIFLNVYKEIPETDLGWFAAGASTNDDLKYTDGSLSGSGYYLEPNEMAVLTIEIGYGEEFVRSDEEFTVEFGDIKLLWESVD